MTTTISQIRPMCANGRCQAAPAKGLLACSRCQLVLYCSKTCQKNDWKKHKDVCNSPVAKESWRPAFELDQRVPSWIPEDWIRYHEAETGAKLKRAPKSSSPEDADRERAFDWTGNWLFDDFPAIDVLKLESNEGSKYGKPIDILFAASGDLASVVKTITSLPGSEGPPLRIVVNDIDDRVMERNLMLLILILGTNDPAQAAEVAVHLWYSAFMPCRHFDYLDDHVSPHLRNTVAALFDADALDAEKAKAKFDDKATQEKRWDFGNGRFPCTLKARLTHAQQVSLHGWLLQLGGWPFPTPLNEISENLTKPWQGKGANADYWDTVLMRLPRKWRVPRQRYHEESVLLPFAQPRAGEWASAQKRSTFRHLLRGGGDWVSNPYFSGGMYGNRLGCSSNPLNSWPVEDILATDNGGAASDIYGKMFYYIRNMLEAFAARVKSRPIEIEMHCCEARDLRQKLVGRQFDRIHASNLADICYMGNDAMLRSLGPLLNPPSVNPSATLVSLHREFNYGNERAVSSIFPLLRRGTKADCDEVEKYVDPVPPVLRDWHTAPYAASSYNRLLSVPILLQPGDAWLQYKTAYGLDRAAAELGLRERARHIVTEEWPMRLERVGSRAQDGRAPADLQNRFDHLAAAGRQSCIRYVEWQKLS